MKRLALAALLALGASTATIHWGPAEGEVAGYRLYRSPAGGGPEEAIDLGAPDEPDAQGELHRQVGFLPGDWRVSMTAYGPGGESARSNEVQLQIAAPPGPPQELRITIGVDRQTGAVRIIEP